MNTDINDRDILSDSHRSYMIRFIEFENLRQERLSKLFLAGRLSQRDKAAPKHQARCSGILAAL
jgi:hypothetical protein